MIEWKEVLKFEVPKGIELSLEDYTVTVKGPKGTLVRVFKDNLVRVELKTKNLSIKASRQNQYTKGIAGTWNSLINSMIKGVQEPYQYEMKIDYTHFPMRVSVRGQKVVIENFLGERSQRFADIVGSCTVSVKGDRVFVSGIDKYEVGETTANIERATKIKGFDLRVFQDGIYLLGGQ